MLVEIDVAITLLAIEPAVVGGVGPEIRRSLERVHVVVVRLGPAALRTPPFWYF